MKFSCFGWLGLVWLVLPTAGFAQDKGAKPSFDAEVGTLVKSYQQAEEKYFEPFSKAKSDEERERIRLDRNAHPARRFLPMFQALAGKAQGTDAGALSLLWVVRLGRIADKPQAMKDALQQMVVSYTDSPAAEELAEVLQYAGDRIGMELCQDSLRKIAENSHRRNVQASALFGLGCVLASDHEASPESKAEMRKLFDRVKKEYADTPYAQQAEGYLFELDHLQIGMTAPDFQATDGVGKSFKLSDYRGKVVMLEFWGFW